MYALKRMRKTAVMQCPEHVFCEQHITRNIAHPFCLRQYASFQARRPRARARQWLSETCAERARKARKRSAPCPLLPASLDLLPSVLNTTSL